MIAPAYRMRDPYMGRGLEAPAFIPPAQEFLAALKMRDKMSAEAEALEKERAWREAFTMKYEVPYRKKEFAPQREYRLGPSPEERAHEELMARLGIKGRKAVAGIRTRAKAGASEKWDALIKSREQTRDDLKTDITKIWADTESDWSFAEKMRLVISKQNEIKRIDKQIGTLYQQKALSEEEIEFMGYPPYTEEGYKKLEPTEEDLFMNYLRQQMGGIQAPDTTRGYPNTTRGYPTADPRFQSDTTRRPVGIPEWAR